VNEILVIVISILVALAVGGWLNRRWAARHPGHGLLVADLINPIATISAILLAFVMVEALASWDRAHGRANDEAHIVDRQAESAARLTNADLALQYQAGLVCYARAVRFEEWPEMSGGGERSPEVDVWTEEFERIADEIELDGGDDELDRLIDNDNERSDARLARLAEADPSLPVGLNLLMLASVIFSILGLAMFMNPDNGRRANAWVMLTFGLIVGGSLIIINDLDRPFDGFTRIEPLAMERTQRSMEKDLAVNHPSLVYPCDEGGLATATG
jgi:hypothetical protein